MSIKEQAFDAAHRKILELKNEVLESLRAFISSGAYQYYDTLGIGRIFTAKCMDSYDAEFYGESLWFIRKDKLAISLNKLYYYAHKEYTELLANLNISEGILITRSTYVENHSNGSTTMSTYEIQWS